jgi:hypothetical protein
MILQMKTLLSFFMILTVLTIFGCKEEINAPSISEKDIIGTWVLTKIIASYPSGKKEMTPQEANLTMTIILNSDKTFQQNQNSKGQVTNNSGTWSVENAVLTIISASGTFNLLCRIKGNILQVASTILDPDSGNVLPITLELTKQ